jgi:hypothetical protein
MGWADQASRWIRTLRTAAGAAAAGVRPRLLVTAGAAAAAAAAGPGGREPVPGGPEPLYYAALWQRQAGRRCLET